MKYKIIYAYDDHAEKEIVSKEQLLYYFPIEENNQGLYEALEEKGFYEEVCADYDIRVEKIEVDDE